ncbi:MAG: insulinase family protein [Bacteroidota bacterium]
MKKIILFSLMAVLTFTQCTPKLADATAKADDQKTQVDKKAEDMADKAADKTAEVAQDFRSKVPAPGPAPKIQLGSYDNFKLSNGLEVIVVENHKLPRVSFQLFVDAPSISEGEHTGYIDIAGDLMSKGTTTRKKSQIDEEVDFIGATLVTDADGIYAESLTKHTDKLVELMADVLLNPSFPEAEFDKIKKQTLSGLAQEKEDPSAISRNVTRVLRYGKDHPYGQIATEATIGAVTLDKCKEYYNTYFKPNISYLVVVGDITADQARPMIENYLGKWKSSNDIPKPTFETPQMPEKTSVDFVDKSGAVQSVIAITYPLSLKPGETDVIPASVLNTMLGGYFQSRLNQNLRETHGYTYGARSSLRSDRNVGFFSAGASVRNEVTDSSLVQFMKEFNKVRDEIVGPKELELVKNSMSGQFARSLERPQTVARFALNTFRYKLPKDYYATYLEKLSKVNAADVMAMAKKYVRPDRAHIVVVGNKDDVVEKIGQFSADKKVNFYDPYGNKVELKEQSLPAGLTADKVIASYIQAIGGMDKVKEVKSMSMTMEAEFQGMKLVNELHQQEPNKYSMSLSMMGSVMQKEVTNGEKGMKAGQAGTGAVEGEELNEMKERALIFPELTYAEKGYKLALKGIEPVDGKDAYKVNIESPSGKKSTDFFDAESGLKIKSMEEIDMGGQKAYQTAEIQDYKEIDGVKVPHTMVISGGGLPMALTMKITDIKVNNTIDPAIFKVE